MMALEMLKCILNGITGNITSGFAERSKNSHVTSQDDALLESALLSSYFTKQMTQSLLNLLISRFFGDSLILITSVGIKHECWRQKYCYHFQDLCLDMIRPLLCPLFGTGDAN